MNLLATITESSRKSTTLSRLVSSFSVDNSLLLCILYEHVLSTFTLLHNSTDMFALPISSSDEGGRWRHEGK